MTPISLVISFWHEVELEMLDALKELRMVSDGGQAFSLRSNYWGASFFVQLL